MHAHTDTHARIHAQAHARIHTQYEQLLNEVTENYVVTEDTLLAV